MKTYRVVLIIVACLLVCKTVLSSEDEDAVVQKYRIEFQNPGKLKHQLISMFSSLDGVDRQGIERLKQRFDISDKIMRSVAMEIYEESLVAVKEKRTDGVDGGLNTYRQQVAGALFCLGLSADQATKQMLMTTAQDISNETRLRKQAIATYLRAADAEEAKNALLRFLVEEDRMSHMDRLSIYEYILMAWEAASPEKKAAILAALIAAANKEEGKIEFMKVDKILAERSAAYRRSRERLAMLERHGLEPPTTNLYTDRDLKAALEESRKYKSHTSITTNLSALKTRNFNLPQLDLATNDALATVDDHSVTGEKSDSDTRRSVGTYVFFGLTAILLLGVGAWKLTRR